MSKLCLCMAHTLQLIQNAECAYIFCVFLLFVFLEFSSTTKIGQRNGCFGFDFTSTQHTTKLAHRNTHTHTPNRLKSCRPIFIFIVFPIDSSFSGGEKTFLNDRIGASFVLQHAICNGVISNTLLPNAIAAEISRCAKVSVSKTSHKNIDS